MTTNHNHPDETRPGHAAHHARNESPCLARTVPHQMPTGGWIRDIAMSENWRTTTIVQRHRDRASITPFH